MYGKNTEQGPVWNGEECRTRAASFLGHNDRTLRGWSQSKPDVAATEKPYLPRNNEAIWEIGAGGGVSSDGVTNADTKQVPHGKGWR